jgi:hypothetical protein
MLLGEKIACNTRHHQQQKDGHATRRKNTGLLSEDVQCKSMKLGFCRSKSFVKIQFERRSLPVDRRSLPVLLPTTFNMM